MTARPLRNPAAVLLAAAVGVALAGIVASCLVAGSAGCTAAQMAAEGPQAVAMMSAACPALTAIPVAGAFVAAACEGAELEVAAAVKQAAAELAADAGAPSAVDARTLRPLYRRRHGRRVVVGYASRCLCAAAQRHLDALDADGGVTQTAAPDLRSDAGAEGGR